MITMSKNYSDKIQELTRAFNMPGYSIKFKNHNKNKYIIMKGYVLILTPVIAMISKEDLYLLKFRYFYMHGRSINGRNRYLCCSYAGKRYMMHNLIMHNTDTDKVVDHINGNTLDNRRENLRVCSKHENSMNRKPNKGKSLPKGVRYYKANTHNPYVAFIYINKKEKNLGAFKTVEEALQVRLEAEKKYYGEFRRKEVK